MSRTSLAIVLHNQGKNREAENEFREVLAIRERVLARWDADIFYSCCELARCLTDQGKKEDALAFARRAVEGYTSFIGIQNYRTKDAREFLKSLTQP